MGNLYQALSGSSSAPASQPSAPVAPPPGGSATGFKSPNDMSDEEYKQYAQMILAKAAQAQAVKQQPVVSPGPMSQALQPPPQQAAPVDPYLKVAQALTQDKNVR